jgi:hypothetical protein
MDAINFILREIKMNISYRGVSRDILSPVQG